jgi:16S rRNA U516 pseudouridylate synthase RsuA-like enzyme
VGLPVLRLVRVRVGALGLGELLPGQVRELPLPDLAPETLFLLPSTGITGI